MSAYWCFNLSTVAGRLLYHQPMQATETFDDVHGVIKQFRSTCQNIRPREAIPV